MGQDGEVRQGVGRVSSPTPAPGWNAEEALRHDRKVERRLLVKEAFIVVLIIALVLLRVAFVR